MSPQVFNNLKAVFAVFCTGLIISCSMGSEQNSQPSQRQNAIEEAQYWIDHNDPDRAIAILESWYDENEVSLEQNIVRTVLASAHVSRSGIELPRFVEFLRNLRNFSKNQEAAFDQMDTQLNLIISIHPDLQNSEEARQAILKFYKFLFVSSQFIQLANAIPQPRSNASNDLNIAIDYLKADNEKMSPGNYLYRGAIRLFLINYKIQTRQLMQSLNDCPIKLSSLEADLKDIQHSASEVVLDLVKALPEQAESLDSVHKAINRFRLRESIQDMDPETFEYVLRSVEWLEERSCQ